MKARSLKRFQDVLKMRSAYLKHSLLTGWVGSGFVASQRRKALMDRHSSVFEEIDRLGYTVIPDYLSEDDCRKAINELKTAFRDHYRFVHDSEDRRIFGVEQIVPAARRLSEDIGFREIGELVNREYTYCAFTLGGWLKSGQNGSSGNGWHRDAYFGQYKAMVYLTEVNTDNGPFEIIEGSHKLSAITQTVMNGGMSYMQNRLSEELVRRVEDELLSKRKTIVGKAGTLLLFNSSAIHRGRPIESGERFALTNYYFPISRQLREIRKQFSPILTADNVF